MLNYKKTRDPARMWINSQNRSTRNFACMFHTLPPRNRSGQVGETVTWVFATLIIIGIVLISIWISFLISKIKVINMEDVKTDLGKGSEQLATKTSIAEQLTNNENKSMIEDILKKQNGG